MARLKPTSIRSSALIGLAELLEESGVDARALMHEVGMNPRALDTPDLMIPFRQGLVLLELAAQRTNRATFGLECIARMPDHFPNAGPLVLLASFVKTYGEWIELAIKYWRYHTDAFTIQQLRVEATGQVISRLHIDELAVPSRQMVELVIGGICALGRVLTNRRNEKVDLVRFQHSAPKDLTLHELVLMCPIEFNADHNEIVYSERALSYEVAGNLTVLKPLVARFVRHRIDRMTHYDSSISAAVSLIIPTLIGTGRCTAETVAVSLGLSPKALQRRLAAEDSKFSNILEDARRNMAARLLIESDISVERLAGLLDYSSTPPFILAFKRWTGTTPLTFRRAEREKLRPAM